MSDGMGDTTWGGSENTERMLAPSIWPLPFIPIGKKHPGAFGVEHHQHVHTGIDLYAPMGCPVTAIETGKIIKISWFTGPSINMPWWRDTRAVYIEGHSGVFNYGEVQEYPDIKVGDTIERGKFFAYVIPVLKKYKGRPMSMLHIELYDHGYTDEWGEWKIGDPKPEHLKGPTPYLLTIMGSTGAYGDIYHNSVTYFKQRELSPKMFQIPSFCEKTMCHLNNGEGSCMEGLFPESCHSRLK